MSRLARDGAAGPVPRDQILRRVRRQGHIHFPCSADHNRIGNLTRLTHTLLCVMAIHRRNTRNRTPAYLFTIVISIFVDRQRYLFRVEFKYARIFTAAFQCLSHGLCEWRATALAALAMSGLVIPAGHMTPSTTCLKGQSSIVSSAVVAPNSATVDAGVDQTVRSH